MALAPEVLKIYQTSALICVPKSWDDNQVMLFTKKHCSPPPEGAWQTVPPHPKDECDCIKPEYIHVTLEMASDE
jgi:hypothetical protein